MKKSLKKTVVVLSVMAAMSTAFAGGLSRGAAGAVGDDSTDFMDLLTWKDLKFKNTFVSANLGPAFADSINLNYATYLKNGNQLALAYDGNLWSDNARNSFTGFMGFNNMALEFGLNQNEQEFSTDITGPVNADVWTPAVAFGMNVNKNFGFTAGFGIGFASVNDIKITIPVINLSGKYILHDKGNFTDSVSLVYSGAFVNMKQDVGPFDVTTGIYTNTIMPSYALEYQLAKNLKYGFAAEVPLTFSTSSVKVDSESDSTTITNVDFTLYNGVIVEVKPNTLSISAGLITELPSLNSEDGKGDLSNSVTAGFAFFVTDGVHVDFNTRLDIFNGISFEEVWKQNWTLSLTARF